MFNLKIVKNFLIFYFPVLVWMGFIFYLSSIPSLKTGASIPVELTFRKTIHLVEYAVLAYLVARMFKRIYQFNFQKILISSFLVVFVFSLSDEFHQSFVVGRSGNFFDVGVDLIGGVVGLLIFRKIFKK